MRNTTPNDELLDVAAAGELEEPDRVAEMAREMLEETGLVVDVGEAIDVFDRIGLDDTGRVRHHYVLIDYLCRPRAGQHLPSVAALLRL